MRQASANDSPPIRLAEDAAEQLFNARNGDASPTYEPSDLRTAYAATRRIGELFNEIPGAIASALDAARDTGDLLSSDRLQGLAEIVQNADDLDASQVRLLLRPTDLLVSHDGSPVQLRHVLGLATPWLSTKGGEADTTGRFGIGLMTLRSLSKTLEVHCDPYHVRLGDPTVSPINPPTLPAGFNEADWTTLRIPIDEGVVSKAELEQWLNRWDDSALLFLRSVSRITLLELGSDPILELKISRHGDGEMSLGASDSIRTISRHRAEVDDGRSWLVYCEDAPSPEGVSRARKATEQTTPIAIAIPQYPVSHGQIHAGLPVIQTHLPLFANAQFDPLTSRRDFADTNWNESLSPLVAELWAEAILDLFARDPKVAWQAIPIPDDTERNDTSPMVHRLEEAIVASARQRVASRLSFQVLELGEVRLSQLAIEAQPLERIVTMAETAHLAGLPATLPFRVRDQAGRWRSVLHDWRTAGADLPEPVSVERALDLVSDETRPAGSTIALAAAGINEDLGERLRELPSVIARDGRHLVPPRSDSPQDVAGETTPLAEQLGIVTLLHTAHLGRGKAARAVLKWLRECGALLDASDDHAVIQRLAAAGRSEHHTAAPLSDEQVQALRKAFELLDPDDQRELGPDVGRAVSLEAYQYEMKGRRKQRKPIRVRAVEAYLPRAVDRETDSFAVAADRSPDLVWLSDHYARILRSSVGRGGVGAQRFLRLLGAEIAPRLRPHPGLDRRYAYGSLGLPASIPSGSSARSEALQSLGATYTLRDLDCPALMVVIQDISRMRSKKQRRKRAGALLSTLGRTWERVFSDFAEVDSAHDYHMWNLKGRIAAYWVWEAGDVSWLDDESGTPRRPSELRVRTPGTVAIYGEDSSDYLHPDLDHPSRRVALSAFGVSGDPSRSELVARLKELRHDSEGEFGLSPSELKREVVVLYKALAQSLTIESYSSDLSSNQLRREFQRHSLVLANLGWHTPQSVLAGNPIFGEYRAFAPAIAESGPLWEALRLREPSPKDCREVIREIAKQPGTPGEAEKIILLETLRALVSHPETGSTPQARGSLARLPLWTSKGWVRDRPVYATDDPVLAEGLRDHIPLWEPGGGLEQFRPLLEWLRVEEIRAADAELRQPTHADEDMESSDFFRSALQQLQDDLGRNDPKLAESVSISWDRLMGFSVRVHPSLTLGVTVRQGGIAKVYDIEVAAKVDSRQCAVFVRSPLELWRVDGGGRALATLFEGDPRRLAQAWRAACDRAETEGDAKPLELAEHRARRDREQNALEIESRSAAFRERTTAKHRAIRGRSVTTPTPTRPAINGREDDEAAAKSRVLVDPQSLRLVDPEGRIEEGTGSTQRRTNRNRQLVEPRPGSEGPRNRSPLQGYSDLDKETVGKELLTMLLGSDHDEIADLRAQRGVGADVVDELRRFYELKVSAGTEPDQVTLTNAEVKRALSTPDFFLVVVSGVEGVDARPTVRVFVDPLKQLHLTDRGAITLSGVRSAKSLVYDFAPNDDPTPVSGIPG